MKKILSFFLLILFFIIGLEFFLRLYYGFCDNVLVREDPDFEYIPQPNQNRFRFRNHIRYNSQSMRSEEIDTHAHLILGFGDSVLNGGVLTDQDSLATSLLSDTLSRIEGKKIQFLNISAGSWGPDNCYAYLKKYGDFGAKSIYLFVSSHDAYDNMNFFRVIGTSDNFSNKQYSLALYEVKDKYWDYLLGTINNYLFTPKISPSNIPNKINLGINKKKDDSIFNTGFASFFSYSKEKNIPLTIYLHAELDEIKAGNYNPQGQEIIKFAKANNIELLMDLDQLDSSYFRDNPPDNIHLRSKGQKKIAELLLKNYLSKKENKK